MKNACSTYECSQYPVVTGASTTYFTIFAKFPDLLVNATTVIPSSTIHFVDSRISTVFPEALAVITKESFVNFLGLTKFTSAAFIE